MEIKIIVRNHRGKSQILNPFRARPNKNHAPFQHRPPRPCALAAPRRALSLQEADQPEEGAAAKSTYLSINLFTYLSICLHLSVYLSIYLSIYLSSYLAIYLGIELSC